MIIPIIRLRNGAGDGNPRDGLCLMQAVHWFSGADITTDHPPCASPVLSDVGIVLNDHAPTQADRDGLWPLVWQLLDSQDGLAEVPRAEHIIREIAHRILAPLFDKLGLAESATALRGALSMREIEAAAEVAQAAGAAGAAEWAARGAAEWAARATAAAAAVARAAAATARLVAWAQVAEAEAEAEAGAEAAARATAAGLVAWALVAEAKAALATARAVACAEGAWTWTWAGAEAALAAWTEMRAIFVEAIALGRHGQEDPVYESRATELELAIK
jgi:hypothetical protein